MVKVRKILAHAVLLPGLLGVSSGSLAAEPLALQQIMRDLDRNMQTITDSIAREDWQRVAKTAPLIADHPQPPLTEKLRILAFAGVNVGRFKAYDGETRDHALAVRDAARAHDGRGVLLAFHKLQTSCLNCHSEFRKPFMEHFYARNDNGR